MVYQEELHFISYDPEIITCSIKGPSDYMREQA